MKYRMEEKSEMTLVGFRRRFDGVPGERAEQEEKFFLETKDWQNQLFDLSGDSDTQYTVIDRVDDTGYDYVIAARLGEATAEAECRFERIVIPAQTYAVFETEREKYPTGLHLPLRKRVVGEWLPFSGYALAEGPEINVIHWYRDEEKRARRYIEIWLPVVKK